MSDGADGVAEGLRWIPENPPSWDDGKARIVGGVDDGIFDFSSLSAGDLVPGEWWRVERDGGVIGFGWMDTTWGDAEITLAVDPGARAGGVGTFILDRLEREAAQRGLNYLYNTVRPTHPQREAVTRWLEARRFVASDGGLLKRAVRRDPA